MLDWLRKFLVLRTNGGSGQESPQFPNTNSKWIQATDNEFGIKVLDCLAFCQSMVSTSDDFRIATTFARLRSSTGEEYRGKLPQSAKSTECDLRYPYDGKHRDGAIFKAREMEDKWDIYLYDNKVYFARSWTGDLIYVAEIRFDSDCVCLTSVTADSERSGEAAFAIGSVDYLLKSHIYRCLVPHPLPNGHPNDPDPIALFAFGQYGRFAGLASFEGTTGIRIPETSPHNTDAFNGEVAVVPDVASHELNGAANRINLSECATCNGSGQCFCIRKGTGNPVGCPRCGGSGECRHCTGTGNR